MKVPPWPEVADEDKWAIELMEERFEETTRTPEELTARAEELRVEADTTKIRAHREVVLALAERYEAAAAARLASA